MSLQTTYPDDATPGHDLHLVADAHRPVDERAGHDRAEAAHCEHAVDRKARPARVRPRRGFFEQRVEGVDKIREALAARCRDLDDRCALQRGALKLRDDLGRDQLEPLLVDQVDLGQRDQAAPHVEQVKDLEVLPRLRHHTFIGRHHEHHGVEAVGPGQHVAHEARVTGHIDDADLAAARQGHVPEPQVDRHATALFFGQAIRVDPGQRGDQRRLAVIDVARGADDEAHLRSVAKAASTASRSVSSSPLNTVRGSRQHSSFSMRAITGGLPLRSAVDSREAGPAIASSTVAR